MTPDPESTEPITFSERCFFFFLGSLVGAIYGVLLAFMISAVSGQLFIANIVIWCAAACALLGYFYENLLIETMIGSLHFLWGLVGGFASEALLHEDPDSTPLLRGLVWIGVITAVAVAIAVHLYYFK